MTRRRKKRRLDRPGVHRLGGMQVLSKDAAESLAMLTGNLAECLSDDGRFVQDVITSCPEALPLADLLRRARAMAEAHALEWRDLSGKFQAYAEGGPACRAHEA